MDNKGKIDVVEQVKDLVEEHEKHEEGEQEENKYDRKLTDAEHKELHDALATVKRLSGERSMIVEFHNHGKGELVHPTGRMIAGDAVDKDEIKALSKMLADGMTLGVISGFIDAHEAAEAATEQKGGFGPN